jgi:hypothetical protein
MFVLCAEAHAQGAVNYQGLWWASPAGAESGWGINFAHQGDRIFATWNTYDVSGKAWWVSMLATRTTQSGSAYAGPILVSNGPPHATFVGPGVAVPAGSGTLTFADANHGTFAYTLNGVSQGKPIVRYDLGSGPQPFCIFSAATPDFATATNYQDLWWVSGGAEPGWGLNVAHQGDQVFATWYTYDIDGAPMWLSTLAGRQGTTNVYAGTVYWASGPRFDDYDPTKVRNTAVGTATLTFIDGNHATFAYSVMNPPLPGPANQAKEMTRVPFGPSGGTLCRAPAPADVKTTAVVVVPLRYDMYDGASQPSLDAYFQTLPKVDQAKLQATMDTVSAWYSRTTFGVQDLRITVLPAVSPGKVNSCDTTQLYNDAVRAAAGWEYGVLIAVTPYSCWQSQAQTGASFITVWGTTQDGAGMYAHEIGHAIGLLHAASAIGGTYVEYGSGYDQMGRGSDFYTLVGFGADHLNKLGALTPMACASATLRSITDYPDAIACGPYYAFYLGDWHNEVWITKREYVAGSRGGSDTTEYAHLANGESYSSDGYTFTNAGGGTVVVTTR